MLSIIIPAPPVWIIAGMTYGVFGGMLICIGGVVIGNAIAFYIGRRFGNKLINVLINKKIRNKLKFLETSDHSAIIEFLLYVIPGVPNNIIPYVYAQTSVSLKKFISIIAIASIPAILSCTFVGHNILSTNIEFVIVVIIIFIILIAIILINNKKIMDWMEKFSS